MPYLIDGHNLIAHMPDIELDDPNDEAKLVLKLRGFCATRRKKVVVVFDQGLPGGTSKLSTHSVKVIFASYNQTNADRIIRERIHNTRDVKGWVVVSSDNEVREEAERNGMGSLSCAIFADWLQRPEKTKLHPGENPNVMVSPSEVDEWLQVFGFEEDADDFEVLPAADHNRRPPTPQPESSAPQVEAPRRTPAPQSRKPESSGRGKRQPAAKDVEGWLEVFGDGGEREPTDKAQRIQPRGKKRPAPAASHEDNGQPGGGADLSENSIEAWLEVFGDEPAPEPTDPAIQRSDPTKQGRYRNERGKREPTVHKRMATSDEIYLNDGEVDAWMDVFGVDDEDEK